MRINLFIITFTLAFSAVRVNAQQDTPASIKPKIGITVLADGKPADPKTGIKRTTKEIRFKALLDTKSNVYFRDFQPSLIIKDVEVSLARSTRRVAVLHMDKNQALIDPAVGALPDDRLVFKFTLAGQRNDGEQVPLLDQPIYSLTIRE